MYIDGGASGLGWHNLMNTSGEWAHVHLQSNVELNENIHFFSRQATSSIVSGNLKGHIGEIYLWARQLEYREVQVIAGGFDLRLPWDDYIRVRGHDWLLALVVST